MRCSAIRRRGGSTTPSAARDSTRGSARRTSSGTSTLRTYSRQFGGMGGGFGFPGFGGMEEQEQTGVNLYLSFDDLERGVEREFEVQRIKGCEHCGGTGGEPGSKQVKCATCDGHGRRKVQHNTIFGRFEMLTACNRCRGRGKVYDKACNECRGEGKVVVRDSFTIRAGKPGSKPKEDTRRKFGVF